MELSTILTCVDNIKQLFNEATYKSLLDMKNNDVNLNTVLVAVKQTIERQDILESALNALEARIEKLENDKNKKCKSKKVLDVPAPFECDK